MQLNVSSLRSLPQAILRSRLTAALLGAVIAVSAGVMVASAGGGGLTINACVNKVSGSVRIIDPSTQSCAQNAENPMSWNQVGPPGPKGDTGATGPQGPAGTPATALWASIGFDPNVPGPLQLVNGSHATNFTIDNNNNFGHVTFDRDISRCVYAATPAEDLDPPDPVLVNLVVVPDGLNPDGVVVIGRKQDGTTQMLPFSLAVFC